MGQAEGDQGQAVEHPGDAQAVFAGDETQTTPVPLSSEPDIQYPGARRHHRDLTGWPPKIHSGREEDAWHSQPQQPKQEKGEQHAGSSGGCALPAPRSTLRLAVN